MILIRKIKSFPKYLKNRFNWYLAKIAKYWVVCNFYKWSRAYLWKLTGAKIGKGVYIGWDVYFDASNASLITLEDDVTITSRVLILCHRRDMSTYVKGSRYNDLPYIKAPVVIKKGASIGMGSIIMPGVTIGEGAIIGAGSLVTKDIPSWTIAVGNPAKVVKTLS
jgi:acetyltransferase-like isoleucine patch superfamily enzyme